MGISDLTCEKHINIGRKICRFNVIKITYQISIVLIIITFLCMSKLVKKNSNNIKKLHREYNITNWIVITTVNKPTDDIMKISQLESWKVVVVADKKTPIDWKVDNVKFLSVKEQIELGEMGLKLPQILPWNTYTRKNIGFLYAILNGAHFIYETDDDNHPNENPLESFDTIPKHINKLKQNCSLKFTNVYSYFGLKNIWPRGFPINRISESKECFFQLYDEELIIPIVQQGLVNGDPDVDAIYRIVNKKYGEDINLHFSHETPIMIPYYSYCPYNSQNTLSTRKSFWGLYLFVTVHMRVTDIWRAYFVQRLLRDIGEFLAFYPPNAYQKRSVHDYLKDFMDEKPLYIDVERFVSVIDNWHSNHDSLSERLLELVEALGNHSLIKEEEREYYLAWLHDLELIGYKSPDLIK